MPLGSLGLSSVLSDMSCQCCSRALLKIQQEVFHTEAAPSKCYREQKSSLALNKKEDLNFKGDGFPLLMGACENCMHCGSALNLPIKNCAIIIFFFFFLQDADTLA